MTGKQPPCLPGDLQGHSRDVPLAKGVVAGAAPAAVWQSPGSGSQPAHSNKVQVCGCPPSNHGWLGPGMSAMHSAEMWGSPDLLAFCIIERKALLIES